jgi:hypothetical protein
MKAERWMEKKQEARSQNTNVELGTTKNQSGKVGSGARRLRLTGSDPASAGPLRLDSPPHAAKAIEEIAEKAVKSLKTRESRKVVNRGILPAFRRSLLLIPLLPGSLQ